MGQGTRTICHLFHGPGQPSPKIRMNESTPGIMRNRALSSLRCFGALERLGDKKLGALVV